MANELKISMNIEPAAVEIMINKIKDLEKRIAVLELRLQEQPKEVNLDDLIVKLTDKITLELQASCDNPLIKNT